MMDLDNKEISNQDGITTEENEEMKKCAVCGTSKTPLWRSGPKGPKSLCNACGIRSRKKTRVIPGNETEKKRVISSTKKSGGSCGSTSSGSTVTTLSSTSKSTRSLDQRLALLGKEVMMQRSTVGKRTPRRKKLGEDEQAAILLMALSYGSVYA